MSSAKLPLWLTFENAEPKRESNGNVAADDLRQDTMVLQLMRVMDSMWRSQNAIIHVAINVWLRYDGGLFEIVKNSQTTADIHAIYVIHWRFKRHVYPFIHTRMAKMVRNLIELFICLLNHVQHIVSQHISWVLVIDIMTI